MSHPEIPDFAAAFERMVRYQQSPDGQREKAEYARADRAKRAHELLVRCDDRYVPKDDGVRDAVVNPLETKALEIVRGTLGWRDAQRVMHRSRRPVVAILAGFAGPGKTSALSWAVANHARPAEYAVARKIGSTKANGHPESMKAIDRWHAVDLLAIDELGTEDSGEPCDRIAALIAERWDAGLVTLAACNLTADVFFERYCNARVASRLRYGQARDGAPGGWPYWHEVPDFDLRNPANLAALRSGAA